MDTDFNALTFLLYKLKFPVPRTADEKFEVSFKARSTQPAAPVLDVDVSPYLILHFSPRGPIADSHLNLSLRVDIFLRTLPSDDTYAVSAEQIGLTPAFEHLEDYKDSDGEYVRQLIKSLSEYIAGQLLVTPLRMDGVELVRTWDHPKTHTSTLTVNRYATPLSWFELGYRDAAP